MRLSYFSVALIVAATLLTQTTAQAGYEFRFADSTGAYSSSFNIASVGSTLDIRVYLVATGAEATTLSTEGLRSFGVRVNYDGTIADVLNTAAISNNAAFTGTDVKAVGAGNVPSDFARSNDATPGAGPYVASTADGAEQRILLATFTFTGISGGTSVSLTTDPFPAISNTSLGTSGTPLDTLIANSSATITVVPEPSSLVLGGLLVAGLTGGAYRRYRLKKSA